MADHKEKQGKEKREHQRFDARINVKFRSGSEFASCFSKNISRGGIFIETNELPDPNAAIELVLDLPDDFPNDNDDVLSVSGKIVRTMTVNEEGKSVHHIAIQFVDIPPKVQLELDRYYSRLPSSS